MPRSDTISLDEELILDWRVLSKKSLVVSEIHKYLIMIDKASDRFEMQVADSTSIYATEFRRVTIGDDEVPILARINNPMNKIMRANSVRIIFSSKFK